MTSLRITPLNPFSLPAAPVCLCPGGALGSLWVLEPLWIAFGRNCWAEAGSGQAGLGTFREASHPSTPEREGPEDTPEICGCVRTADLWPSQPRGPVRKAGWEGGAGLSNLQQGGHENHEVKIETRLSQGEPPSHGRGPREDVGPVGRGRQPVQGLGTLQAGVQGAHRRLGGLARPQQAHPRRPSLWLPLLAALRIKAGRPGGACSACHPSLHP